MTQLDPIDETLFREVVGACLGERCDAMDAEVMGTRWASSASGWAPLNWRAAQRRLRADLAALKRDRRFSHLGHIDVLQHYPTVNADALGGVLRSMGCSDPSVQSVLDCLAMLGEVPGHPSGLPIGPEGSSVLGTAALLPVDRAIRYQLEFWRRWTDDYTVGLRSEEQFHEVVGTASAQIATLGQALNPSKTYVEEIEEHEPPAPSGPDDGVEISGNPMDLTLDAIIDSGDLREVPRVLGGMKAAGDRSGLEILRSNPVVLHRHPKQTAKYVAHVATNRSDVEWIGGFLADKPTDEDASAQFWCARILAKFGVDAALGKTMFERSTGLDRMRFAPLADQLAVAAGASDEPQNVRHRRALGAAEALQDLNGQRALVSTCAGGTGRSTARGLRHLARLNPDLEAITWLATQP